MSSGIEEPYTIAALPKPLHPGHGRIQAGIVYSWNGSRKRKRHEVAVGIDGESVNIYNVQNQSTSSSYALPPQSQLAVPPCSIYCKRTKPLQPQRHTYLAVHNGRHNQKGRLVSITEDLGKPQSGEREPRAPGRRECLLRYGKVVGLNVVPLAQITNGATTLLVSYVNGSVDCISGDLTGTRWEHTAENHGEVEFSAVMDLESARRGVLRGREDVLALLGSNMTETVGSTLSLLCHVVRSQDHQRTLQIYALRNVGTTALQGQRSPVEEIISYELQGRYEEEDVEYDLHAGSGTLYQRLGQRLTVFDLSGTTPRILFELGKRASQHVQSFARISTGAVITVADTRIAVYDTKYGSTLAALPLAQDVSETTDSSLKLLSTFTDLGIVVAVSGNRLIALQLGDALKDARRSKTQAALLSDVMGKGKYTNEAQQIDVFERKEKKKRKWEAWKTAIDGMVAERDVQELEKRLAEDLRLDHSATKSENTRAASKRVATGYAGDAASQDWNLLPRHYDPQNVDRKKAVYILGKLFAWRSRLKGFVLGQQHLELALESRNILRWLALAGYLTSSEVQHALPQTAAEFSSRPYVAPGDIMRAISEADPSFELLCGLISLPAHWDLLEVVQGLKVLIASFEDQNEPAVHQLLTTNGDIEMANGDHDAQCKAQLEVEEAAALRDIDRVTHVLEAGLLTRSAAFRECLSRLQAFPHGDISKAMRALLSQEEIIFFIHMMRVELVNGGWTKMYEEQSEQDSAGLGDGKGLSPSNQALRTIASLISCSIDAIGLSGWLVGQSRSNWSTDDLVESMVNETSAVVEGIYHAENLDTILQEIEKTAASAQEQAAHKRKHDEMEWSGEGALLPLGSRSEPPILDGRKRKAVMAEQKSRSIGKYSFERIRV